MSDADLGDVERPRRLWRGPPPRLYVLDRQSPVGSLRLRRLGNADRPALLAHLTQALRSVRQAGDRCHPAESAVGAQCAALDLHSVPVFAAVAGNLVVAAACRLPGPGGPQVVATIDPAYARHGLDRMLASQLLGTPGLPVAAMSGLGRLMLCLLGGAGCRTGPGEAPAW